MFIKTNDSNFIETIETFKGDEVVTHYNCKSCDDEQVTYPEEITDDIIQQYKDKGESMVKLGCTNCGIDTLFLTISHIQGVELM